MDTATQFLWHYTAGVYVPRIVNDSLLKPTNVGAPKERPLLWFSSHQAWEPTSTKMVRSQYGKARVLTFEEQARQFGCVRFGLPIEDPRLMDWPTACQFAGTPPSMRLKLERYGAGLGAMPQQLSLIHI